MRWGHPSYMQLCWGSLCGNVKIFLDQNIRYPSPNDKVTKTLEDALRKTHQKFNNANTDNKHFVLGNGAIQIILASLYSIQKQQDRLLNVHAQPPYWVRFKELTDVVSTKLHWTNTHPGYSDCIEIKAIPNNPDNIVKTIQNTAEFLITDLCYNWHQYTEPKNYDEDLMVFSLSKMTGHAGSRIGWAWVKDKELAALMNRYIEITVGGISLDSQMKTLEILRSVNYDYVFYKAEKILQNRWDKFLKVSKLFQKEYEVINQSGMFIWCKAKSGKGTDLFKQLAQVLGVSGINFGVDDSYVRLNLGCNEKDFSAFIDNLYLTLKP